MKYKEFNVNYNDDGNGSIEGHAASWIEQNDSYGDTIRKGAFARTLKDRWNGGRGIPLLWNHQMDNLGAYIGTANAEEDEKGLHFLATFDGTEEAQRVRNMYKDGRLSKFSFAYDVVDAGAVMLPSGEESNQLRDVELYEISCVFRPANEDASVVSVKSGRRNSAKDADAIRQAITLLQEVLGELDDTDEEREQDSTVKSEEPDTVNDEEREMIEELREKAKKLLNGGQKNDLT